MNFMPIKVAAVLITVDNKVLISKRPPKAVRGGLWEFPGGKLEVNETVLQAAKREILEELNIELINKIKYLTNVFHSYDDISIRLYGFTTHILPEQLPKHQEILLIDPFNLPKHIILTPPDYYLLDDLKKCLKL